MHICSLCGLFGAHKNHKIIANTELKIQNKALTAEIESKLSLSQLFLDSLKNDSFSKIMQDKMSASLSRMRAQLLSMYNVC